MHEGIYRVQAEVCISAASEENARKFAEQQKISQKKMDQNVQMEQRLPGKERKTVC